MLFTKIAMATQAISLNKGYDFNIITKTLPKYSKYKLKKKCVSHCYGLNYIPLKFICEVLTHSTTECAYI